MGAIMIKCPSTGREISTGFAADRASFSATPVFFARVQCPSAESSMNGSPGTRGFARTSHAPRPEAGAVKPPQPSSPK